MCDYQENVTTGHTNTQTPDKVIRMCRYASQTTQKQPLDPLSLSTRVIPKIVKVVEYLVNHDT